MKLEITVATLLLLLLARPGMSAPIETTQFGLSRISLDHVDVAEEQDEQIEGRVSVFARSDGLTAPRVSTAARSGFSGEMAANVSMDDKLLFSGTDVLVISKARFEIEVAPDNAFARRAALDFFLPPSLLEATSTEEVPDSDILLELGAVLRVCFALIACPTSSVFEFDVRLAGSWRFVRTDVSAEGDAALDLSPLRNPTVTDVGGPNAGVRFLRTTTVEFEAFHGHLDLGLIPPGQPLRVEYSMEATGSAIRLLGNVGLAAINDPFLLDTDPVQPGVPLNLSVTPRAAVPMPAAWKLLVGGLALAGALARRRPRDGPR